MSTDDAPDHWDYESRCRDVNAALEIVRERVAEWSVIDDPHGWWHERPYLIALMNEVENLRRSAAATAADPPVGDVVTTLEEKLALPYGTVLIADDGTSADGHDLLQVDGMGYHDEPWEFPDRYTGYVLWDRHDRWLAFDEVGPLTIIHVPPSEEETP